MPEARQMPALTIVSSHSALGSLSRDNARRRSNPASADRSPVPAEVRTRSYSVHLACMRPSSPISDHAAPQ